MLDGPLPTDKPEPKIQDLQMLHNHYLHHLITLLLLVTSLALPTRNHETSTTSTLDVDANIDFSSYPTFTSLKPCLRSFFGGPRGGGADNQVAINVQCVANSCLCTPENIEENFLYFSSQLKEGCAKATNLEERIRQATSVLSGYCSMVTAGVTTTTLGGGSSKPTSTTFPTREDDATTGEEPYPLPDDPIDEDEQPSKRNSILGVSKNAFIGICVSVFFGLVAMVIGLRSLYYARKAHQWREARS